MSLEHVNFTVVAIILLIPIVCCIIPALVVEIRHWREKRREIPVTISGSGYHVFTKEESEEEDWGVLSKQNSDDVKREGLLCTKPSNRLSDKETHY